MKSYYHVLSIPISSHFPWKSIWMVKAPSRVLFFMWMAALWKILMLDNLRRMNIIVVDWCCMYKKSGESIDHILLQCETVRELWSLLIHLFGVWVMPRRVRELLVSWR